MGKDIVLMTWIICDLIKDIFLLSGSIYLVIWKGCSGWWIILAMILSGSPTLFKVLKKRYEIKEENPNG